MTMTPEDWVTTFFDRLEQQGAPPLDMRQHWQAPRKILRELFDDAIREAINAAYERAIEAVEKRRDTWRAEADTYAEAKEAQFVRSIRAGEAQNISALLRSLKDQG